MDDLLEPVRRILMGAFPGSLAVHDPECLKAWNRNDVVRVRVTADDPGVPATVIVKRIRTDVDRGFDDWAGVHFLTTFAPGAARRAGAGAGGAAAPGLAPRFVGGDHDRHLFVMEDLGDGPTLEDMLVGTDPEEAAAAFADAAIVAGRMHAATLGLEREYLRMRDALALARPAAAARQGAALRDGLTRARAWFPCTGVAEPAGFEKAALAVARRMELPEDFLAYTHGDLAPSTCHFPARPGRPILLDFEYGGFRHALHDALFWQMACPLPAAAARRADASYRRELAVACSAARDDAAYGQAQALVAAGRMLSALTWMAPELLAADRPWAPDITGRQALLHHLKRALPLVGLSGGLEPLWEAFRRLEANLSHRWRAEGTAPFVWPAFRGEQVEELSTRQHRQ
jgi:hypothetical protein